MLAYTIGIAQLQHCVALLSLTRRLALNGWETRRRFTGLVWAGLDATLVDVSWMDI